MDYKNLTHVLDSFDKEKGTFGYNEANRHSTKFRISPMIKDDHMGKEELEFRYNEEINAGQKDYADAANGLKAQIGDEWYSMRNQFKRGSSRTATFITDDEEDEKLKIADNRFSRNINIRQELELAKQRKAEEAKLTSQQNFELNRTEWQHMDYNTSRRDRATRTVIKERKKDINAEKDYNRAHETGNTAKITKECSIRENENIIQRHDRGSNGVFRIRTTLVADDDGDCIERDELLADSNINVANSNTADAGEYKDYISRSGI